jgi:hypothetical protein
MTFNDLRPNTKMISVFDGPRLRQPTNVQRQPVPHALKECGVPEIAHIHRYRCSPMGDGWATVAGAHEPDPGPDPVLARAFPASLHVDALPEWPEAARDGT